MGQQRLTAFAVPLLDMHGLISTSQWRGHPCNDTHGHRQPRWDLNGKSDCERDIPNQHGGDADADGPRAGRRVAAGAGSEHADADAELERVVGGHRLLNRRQPGGRGNGAGAERVDDYITTPTLQNGVTYMWAVSASNSAGSSATSAVVYFTVSVNKFNIGNDVVVSGTGGAGLNLRSCANTTCTLIVNMPDGTVMQVIGGPTAADGYTWWNLSGTVSGVNLTGWAIQDYLTK